MKKRNIAGAFLAAPAILLAAYLISLPVYFIALSWCDGRYAFFIETAYIVSFAAAGFFGLRPWNRVLRDDGSGDTYLLCSLFLVLLILALFRENEKYAMPLAGLLYPEDLRYRPEPDFPSGSAAENLRNLVRYSAVSICTYTASFCMSFTLLCRTKWNQYVPVGIAALRRYFGREKAAEQWEEAKTSENASGPESTAYAAGSASGNQKKEINEMSEEKRKAETDEETREEGIRRNMRKQLFEEFSFSPDLDTGKDTGQAADPVPDGDTGRPPEFRSKRGRRDDRGEKDGCKSDSRSRYKERRDGKTKPGKAASGYHASRKLSSEKAKQI